MSPEKDAELYRKYPMLYNQRNGDMKETCMCWGFECQNGWYDLIDELSAKLEAINQTLPEGEKIVAAQVKEKFSGLRFYIDLVQNSISEKVYELIGEAEKKSYTICEQCGKPGKQFVENNWVSTVCPECRKQTKS